MNETHFVIHHLTDIHIGPLHHAANVPDWFKEYRGGTCRNLDLYVAHLQRYAQHLDRDRDKLPDLVVISGDLTSYGTYQEMNKAGDAIGKMVLHMKCKQPEWRRAAGDAKVPYVAMVPGNHDLEWSKVDHITKVESFARMADAFYAGGEVLSSNYHGSPRDVYFDFGDEANVFIYLLDSTYLGGVEDPTFKNIHEQIARFQQLLNSPAQATDADLRTALDGLQKFTRRDPGYVTQDALDKMRDKLSRIPPGRLKIAVVHHNPTTVPSDDVDPFDVIINAGRVKQALAMCGFDVVLYGHRHIFHCSQERLQLPRQQRPLEAELGEGVLFVAGDSLGCKSHAPFVELSFNDMPAHQSRIPVCLLSIYTWRNERGEYEPDSEPAVQTLLKHSDLSCFGSCGAQHRPIRILSEGQRSSSRGSQAGVTANATAACEDGRLEL